MMTALFMGGAGPISLTIAADTTDYNVFVAAGSPAARVDVVLTINAGVVVYQTSNNGAIVAWVSSGFAAGSTLKIVNNGTICGRGGDAGNGGPAPNGTGTNGASGLTAIYLNAGGSTPTTTIDNTNGNIFGGGGGGGGAGGKSASDGGGGGGGRGRLGGAHGSKATGSITASDGTDGSFSAPGTGGFPRAGAGGDWGQPGVDGDVGGFPGFGGPAGKALSLNGNTITWSGGNNSTQVKGAVA